MERTWHSTGRRNETSREAKASARKLVAAAKLSERYRVSVQSHNCEVILKETLVPDACTHAFMHVDRHL